MLIHQFEVNGLSHYSYAVSCKAEGEVAIIDPSRDIKRYIEYAAENRLKISYVMETHIHADYASGAKELAEKTGAELLLSGYDDNEIYEYKFNHRPLKDGDMVELGSCGKIRVLHTPGHTPEHISFLLYDNEEGDEPVAFFTGDFLFIGSVGRPDLLGEESREPLARQMYQSVRNKLKGLPDSLMVYPGHGAGSLCGAGMGKEPSTTLGDQRRFNPYLDESLSEEAFVQKLLAASPLMPQYYLRMKRINSDGPEALEKRKPQALAPEEFAERCDDFVLDLRHPLAFGAAHIDGAVNIGMPDQLAFWAGWVVPQETPVYLVPDVEENVEKYVRALSRVGIDQVEGYLEQGITKWIDKGYDFTDIPQVSVHFLKDLIDSNENIVVLDVRSESEWKSGHIKNAKHMYLGTLPQQMKELSNRDATIFCICGGGYRSSIAASLLHRKGFELVYNVFGGMSAWKAAEYKTVEE